MHFLLECKEYNVKIYLKLHIYWRAFFTHRSSNFLAYYKNTSFTSAKSSSVTKVSVEVVVLVLPIFSSGFLRPSGEFLIFQRGRLFENK